MLIHICSVVGDAGETSSFVGRTEEEASAKARAWLEDRVLEAAETPEDEETVFCLSELRAARTKEELKEWCEEDMAYYSLSWSTDTLL